MKSSKIGEIPDFPFNKAGNTSRSVPNLAEDGLLSIGQVVTADKTLTCLFNNNEMLITNEPVRINPTSIILATPITDNGLYKIPMRRKDRDEQTMMSKEKHEQNNRHVNELHHQRT